MRACCLSRKWEEDAESNCEAKNNGGDGDDLWLRPGDAPPRFDAPDLSGGDELMQDEKNIRTLQRHRNALGTERNLLAYHVSGSSDPSSPNKQQAHHIPCNTTEGVLIENEFFVGKVIFMYKPHGGLEKGHLGHNHPYYRYFRDRKRFWEFRVQGRFKRAPTGDLYVGIVLKDFNYNQAVARYSTWLKGVGMKLVNYDLYMSWGDRLEAANRPDAELSHLVTNMAAWDQIIITPKGVDPPLLQGDFRGKPVNGQNLERKEMGLAAYAKAVDEVFRCVNLEDTFTMCFWGVSEVIDLLGWDLKMMKTRISMARFFDDDPLHGVMYEIERSPRREDETNGERRQLESTKRYYLDFMFWSNSVMCRRLPQAYQFYDAAEELERFSSRSCSATGKYETARSDGQLHDDTGAERDGTNNQGGWTSWMGAVKWSSIRGRSADKSSPT
mmetsp:Transcript_129679/g.258704  ORF Transcript_129679/g.258704 Transcript_129679/m.258704 type:complete len:441 (-) Transcript_129679:121-1443(-)